MDHLQAPRSLSVPTSRRGICPNRRWCRSWCLTPTSDSGRTGTAKTLKVYPALARVPRDLFGVCVVSSTGRVYGAGEIQARLRAMKIGLLIMAGLSLLAVIPAGRLPHYLPGELPGDGAEAREARSR
jgi:hypothetical protein